MPELEQTEIEKYGECNHGIHTESCYAMFRENQSGLAKHIRALKVFHHGTNPKWGDMSDSYVGDPHELCIVLEKLQYLRFQTLCNIESVFVTHPKDMMN